MNVIDVTGLAKAFNGVVAVDHIDLRVAAGEIVGFLGPNGSGKTTTIRMICGLLTPDAGEGTVLGFDVRRDSALIKREVGYMTQKFSLYEDLTIEENLTFVARLYHLAERPRVVAATLDALGLKSRRHQTAGVDPKARREFWDEIHRLASGGLTVLVSTHYMDEAERCHRINYISYGKMLAAGTVSEVVRASGLSTFVVIAPPSAALMARIEALDGVEQVAPFGAALHVSGVDHDRLAAALAPLAREDGVSVAPGETNLEDVFIHFMGVGGGLAHEERTPS